MTIWLTMLLLVGAGLALIALPANDVSDGELKRLRFGNMALLTLLALMALLGPDASVASGELAYSRLTRLSVSTLLILFAIGWPSFSSRSEAGRHLLVIAGAAMALSANSLLTLWIGLVLFLLEEQVNALLDDRWSLLGMLAVLSGLTLLYAATGELHLDAVGRSIAVHAGPQPITLYAGLGLLLAGIGLSTRLLGPSSDDVQQTGRRMLLGALLLLRIAGHVPTLWWEWRWMLGLASLAQVVITLDYWLQHGSRQGWDTSWVWMLQSVVIMFGLAFCQTPLGLGAVLGLALVMLSSMAAWRLLVAIGIDPAQATSCTGLLSRNPGTGIALGIVMLSLAGLPLSLGLQIRILLTRVLMTEGMGWPVWLLIAALGLSGGLYVPNLLALIGSDKNAQPTKNLVWAHLALYALASATLALGSSATPLIYLTHWLLQK